MRASRSRWFVGSSSSSSVGPAEQQLRERDAHLPAAGERLGRLREIGLREPQAFEHLRHAQVDAVALFAAEELREVVVPDEQRLVLAVGQRRIGQRVLDPVDLGARFEQRTERERRFVDERASRVLEAVLRQIADRQAGRLDDDPRSGSSRPASIRSSVVLPAPFGPQRPTRSPSSTCQVTSSSRTRSPKAFVRPESWIMQTAGRS